MSLLGKLLYDYYYKHRPDPKVVKKYGGRQRYNEMLACEKEMRNYALSSLIIDKPFGETGKHSLNLLTGEKFIHQSLFCVHSFFSFLTETEARDYSVTFFSDSSFKPETIEILNERFPNIELVTFEKAMANLELKLPKEEFPYIHKKSGEVAHFNKLFFSHTYGNPGFKVFLDSDMLFFKKPVEFISWLENNSTPDKAFIIEDIEENYGYSPEIQTKIAGRSLARPLNVGFYGIHTASIDFNKVENMIKEMDTNYKKSYYAEQFVTAVLVTDQKEVTILPKDRYIVFPTTEQIEQEAGVLHHYVDISKFGYFTQSWKSFATEREYN